jgi:hypothetical protein
MRDGNNLTYDWTVNWGDGVRSLVLVSVIRSLIQLSLIAMVDHISSFN